MATSTTKAKAAIERLLDYGTSEEVVRSLLPLLPSVVPLPAEVPEPRNWRTDGTGIRRRFLAGQVGKDFPALFGEESLDDHSVLRGNIESFIGMTQIPTGVIGPLRVNGADARGDYYIPMATTEGALVASYNRGARLASQAGGVSSICLTEMVQRSPCFEFANFGECGLFLIWVLANCDRFHTIVKEHSSHAKLEEIRPNMDGNQIALVFDFTTGDAAGQNMVTICSDAICQYIIQNAPMKPRHWYVEGNLSGDKKATSMSFTSVRGKKVTAEAFIPRERVRTVLNTTPEEMMSYWKTSVMNGVQSGSIGVNGHFANGLAAIFLACGQDVACVSEASVGTTRFDIMDDGGLYVCVTLPNLIVGTVGGGTSLPTQRDCLQMINCHGQGGARRFAEICAATVLCGELSIVGAIAAGDFAKAHALYGRRKERGG